MLRLNIASGLQRLVRGAVIWRAVLTLLALLWWDGQDLDLSRGSPTRERRAERQQQRAQMADPSTVAVGVGLHQARPAAVLQARHPSGRVGQRAGIASGQRAGLQFRSCSDGVGGGARPALRRGD